MAEIDVGNKVVLFSNYVEDIESHRILVETLVVEGWNEIVISDNQWLSKVFLGEVK